MHDIKTHLSLKRWSPLHYWYNDQHDSQGWQPKQSTSSHRNPQGYWKAENWCIHRSTACWPMSYWQSL